MLEADPEVVAGAKRMIRKQALGLRGSMPAEALLRRSAAIVARLLALPAVEAARSVALFWPIVARAEVDLRSLDAALRARGTAVAYPSTLERATRRMTFRLVADPACLVDRGNRFPEPPPDAPEALALDVVVIPALAWDGRGHRLGYGAGYYDRALPRFCPPALKIGVGWDFELAVELPTTAEDVAADLVVTDVRTLAIA
ncbi:MAG: 5-formyltetrahydrofolate cyclo-ligase [Polyangiaceae bacterium]|nr:5-formyltetrahydrofolate cyclo-ligase [Polyangiaceae bacterium]